MLFWTHLVVGLFGTLLFVSRHKNWLGFLIFGVVGSVFLDIDSPNSKIGRKFFSRVFMSFTKHRGFIHSLLFVFFIYFVLNSFFGKISEGFLIGALIHLTLDCITKRGVRLFFPFRYRCKGFVKSGGLFEIFLFLVFLVGDFIFIIFLFLN